MLSKTLNKEIMKPIKIIDIERTARQRPSNYPLKNSDSYYLASWGGLFTKRLKKKYQDLDIEVWKAEPDFKKIYQRKANDVDCRVFPYTFHLYSVVTLSMLITLYKLQKKYQLVMYRSTLFDWKFVIMTSILIPKAKIIVSHHGNRIPEVTSLKMKIIKKLLEFSFSRVTTATYLRGEIKNWINGLNNSPKTVFLPVGADFSAFSPLNKEQCRKELGLSHEKTYAVYVGSCYRLKGVDIILELLREFKNTNFDVLFVGVKEGDELFDAMKQSQCKYWGYVGWDLLCKIYSAADFYIHPAFHYQFGGLDVSIMESLACGTPVLSPQLLEFDFDYSELGIAVKDKEEFRSKFIEMLSKYDSFTQCRFIAQKYLDGNGSIIDKLYQVLTLANK